MDVVKDAMLCPFDGKEMLRQSFERYVYFTCPKCQTEIAGSVDEWNDEIEELDEDEVEEDEEDDQAET